MGKNISDRLRLFRERIGYKQGKLSVSLGIKQSTWSNYETGARNISYEILIKLVTQFEINLNWLFTGEGPVFIKDLYTDPPALSNHVAEPEAVYAELDNKTNTMLFGLLRDEQITPGELLDAVIHIRRVRRRSQTKTVSLPS